MIKRVLDQIVTNVIVICVYAIFALAAPILFDLEIPTVLIFSWGISPLITTIVVSRIKRFKPYITTSFVLNLIYISIYTWYESLKPIVPGDFMDFRGIEFIVLGFGSAIGILFSFIYLRFLKNRNMQV